LAFFERLGINKLLFFFFSNLRSFLDSEMRTLPLFRSKLSFLFFSNRSPHLSPTFARWSRRDDSLFFKASTSNVVIPCSASRNSVPSYSFAPPPISVKFFLFPPIRSAIATDSLRYLAPGFFLRATSHINTRHLPSGVLWRLSFLPSYAKKASFVGIVAQPFVLIFPLSGPLPRRKTIPFFSTFFCRYFVASRFRC